MATRAELVFELYVRWRDAALKRFSQDQLPTVDELTDIALNTTLLRPENATPMVNVWGKPLTLIRALVDTDNAHGFDNLPDSVMYLPALQDGRWPQTGGTAAPEPEPEPVVEEPEPEVAAASTPEPVNAEDAVLRGFEPTDFRRLGGFTDVQPIGVVKAYRHDHVVSLEWSAPENLPGKVRLFRVVSDEAEFDLDPDEGEQRCVTVATRWEDSAPLTTALRLYQVWVHTGENELLALQSEPQLVGEDSVILPVEDFELSYAGGEVSGQWSPQPGTERVAVYCATERERVTVRSKNEIEISKPNLQGFRITPEQRGVAYKFVAQRQVKLRGAVVSSRYSPERSIDVPAEVSEVRLFVARRDTENNVRFDASWEPPSSGEVRIYRTQQPPEDGLGGKIIDVAHLEEYGLTQRDWANDLERGEHQCSVAWPADWFTIYLTPVSVVGEKCMVGRSYSQVRVGDVTNAYLRERVVNQLVTFGWPRNAHQVTAFLGSPPEREQLEAIDQQTYEAEGGMRLTLRTPGDIFLVPSVHHCGDIVWGEETKIAYRGLIRLAYSIRPNNGLLFVLLYAQYSEQVPRSFTLRWQPNRLPLEVGDGVAVRTRKHGRNAPSSALLPGVHADQLDPENQLAWWEIDPEFIRDHPGGFLRLFSNEQHDSTGRAISLQDPDVRELMVREQLRLMHQQPAEGNGSV